MGRKLRNQVVVLTGASSGIGRATARRLAGEGASVVLAARDVVALGEVVRECERAGGRAIAVPTDVTDEQAVAALAARAEAAYGRIDVWVNDAAVAAYGPIEDVPIDEVRRVLDVNVVGYVLGMQEAIRRFKQQGHGTIVNVSSLVSYLGTPFLSAYVLSKHATHGLTKSVRQELRGTGIHVVDVLPGVIDTPFYQHAANHTGRPIKAPNPTIRPEAVARAIELAIRRPKRRERAVGVSTRLLVIQQRHLPGLTERAAGAVMRRDEFHRGEAPETSGNLFEPAGDDRERGGWRGGVQGVVRKAAIGGAAVAAVQVARRRAA